MGSFLLVKTGKGSKRDTEFPRISRTLVTGSSAQNSAVQCIELQGIELTYSADKRCVSPCVMFPITLPLFRGPAASEFQSRSILFYALVLATRTLLSSSPPIYYSHFTFWREFPHHTNNVLARALAQFSADTVDDIRHHRLGFYGFFGYVVILVCNPNSAGYAIFARRARYGSCATYGHDGIYQPTRSCIVILTLPSL